MNKEERMQEAVYKFFGMPEDIETLIYQANFDLYFGSSTVKDNENPYPGFSEAVKIIRDWIMDNTHDVYYDYNADEVLASVPDPDAPDDIGFYFEGLWCFEDSEVARILLGSELAKYV